MADATIFHFEFYVMIATFRSIYPYWFKFLSMFSNWPCNFFIFIIKRFRNIHLSYCFRICKIFIVRWLIFNFRFIILSLFWCFLYLFGTPFFYDNVIFFSKSIPICFKIWKSNKNLFPFILCKIYLTICTKISIKSPNPKICNWQLIPDKKFIFRT